MGVAQGIVLAAATATVVAAYVRWIRDTVRHGRRRRWLAPDWSVMGLIATIGLAGSAVGLAFWSLEAGAIFLLFAFAVPARWIVTAIEDWRRRQPVEPEDRQRRYEDRVARRLSRARAMERYGPQRPRRP